MGTRDLALVADVLVPLGAILTVVTAIGTVQWLKGKRWLALLAPLSVVSVFGIVGTSRVARPDSPWAAWRYDDDRMAQACARFGGPPHERPARPAPSGVANAGFALVLVGVVAGVPLGAATSLVGGVLLGHAWLARFGRAGSRRVCRWLAATAGAVQLTLLVTTLPALTALPGLLTTTLTATAAVALTR